MNEFNQISREGGHRFAHTSVTGAGSLARRAAFLAQRVFASDLMYVEPVFLGFNLLMGRTPNARTAQTEEVPENQI